MKVEGLVALITGGASGFGKGFASALLQKGAKGVSLVDVSDGKAVTDEFSRRFGRDRVLYHRADVTSDSDMEDAFKKTVDHFKRLDVVCNNAGIADESDFQKVIDIDLTAVIRGTILAKKYMDKNNGGNGGVVINVSSMAGILFVPFQPVYAAAKHGVIGYSKSLASPGGDPAFAPDNIRVNMVCPSFSDTPIIKKTVAHLSPADFKEFKASLDFVPRRHCLHETGGGRSPR